MTIATEAGHWYTPDGQPAYEIPSKSGIMRPTTLRDARKMGLFPSVNGIIKCANAEALNTWKINQHLITARMFPRYEEETPEDYVARIVSLTKETLSKAPDLGTTIHACIEKHLLGEPYDKTYEPHVMGAVKALDEWCGASEIQPEKSFAHELGYGGKVDIHTRIGWDGFVVDFKSKDFTEEKLPDIYDNHAMQTSAYREGLRMPRARCAIIYVSTKVPGLTHCVEVPQDDLERGWDMFRALLTYWKLKNKYEPGR